MAEHIVKLRGLPWSASEKDILDFLTDVTVARGEEGVHITLNKEGRPSGEAFVEVDTKEDIDRALGHDNEHMGKRYIEVKEAKQEEMEWALDRSSGKDVGANDGVVRLRGLPFKTSSNDVMKFFSGLKIVPGGITIANGMDGRPSGEAFVEFASVAESEKALLKNKDYIGSRYIEVFKSSKDELLANKSMGTDMGMGMMGGPMMGNGMMGMAGPMGRMMGGQRPGPYDRPGMGTRGRGGMNLGPSGFGGSSFDNSGGGMGVRRGGKIAGSGGRSMGGGNMGNRNQVLNSTTGHSIHMRGLPFEASQNDVMKFFQAKDGEAKLAPVQVRILFEPNGRAKGEADVDFASHADAERAMQKDKQNMGHRYIELFLKSTPDGNNGWGGQTGMGGGMMNQGAMMGNNMMNQGGMMGGNMMGQQGGIGMGGSNSMSLMSQGMQGNMGMGMNSGMNANYTNFSGGNMNSNFSSDGMGMNSGMGMGMGGGMGGQFSY